MACPTDTIAASTRAVANGWTGAGYDHRHACRPAQVACCRSGCAAHPWPVNAWYVAATAAEVTDKPLARQITGRRMVFFRPESGGVVALEDFCPHRGAPLSLGFVRGDTIVCGYHGLALNCKGRPDNMPGQQVGKFPAARNFPVIERYGFVWVWPGDLEQASADKLHPLPWAESGEWAYGGGLFHIACDYRLMIDNLMDLTHETYVHASSIGQKEIDEAPVKTEVTPDEVVTSRTMDGVTAPPFWRMALRGRVCPKMPSSTGGRNAASACRAM
ncbi:Rieske 2Fe-2S domain-containing protein [Sphingomonas panni]